jgi:hypothetical protein
MVPRGMVLHALRCTPANVQHSEFSPSRPRPSSDPTDKTPAGRDRGSSAANPQALDVLYNDQGISGTATLLQGYCPLLYLVVTYL